MRIAVLEDNNNDLALLYETIIAYLSAESINAEVDVFSYAEEFIPTLKPGMYNIAFIDIYLGIKNGMEAARELYRIDPECRLVFYTESDKHAIESYEVRARYYLIKPLNKDRFNEAMSVCLEGIGQDNRLISVHKDRLTMNLSCKDIKYINSNGRRCDIHLNGRTLSVSDSFGSISAKLSDDSRFYNCNKGLLVNLDFVSIPTVEYLELIGGEKIPIRQKGAAQAKRAFISRRFPELSDPNPCTDISEKR